MLWAIVGGLCLDLLSSGPFGLMTVSLIITSRLAGLGYGRVFGGYIVLPLVFSLPLSLVYYLIYTLILNVLSSEVAWLPTLTNVILPASLLNVGVMLLLLPSLRMLSRFTGREEIGW